MHMCMYVGSQAMLRVFWNFMQQEQAEYGNFDICCCAAARSHILFAL